MKTLVTTAGKSNTWVSRSLAAVWHPCTQMKHHEGMPLVAITHGKGPWLYDDRNQAILDCISSWWTNLFGHSNPFINQRIQAQLEKIEHVMLAGFTHQPVIELSEQLSALTNHRLGHAFYASDGASAVEIALKMSYHYWQLVGKPNKNKFICLRNSYHGETLGALAVTDVPLFRKAYGALLSDVFTVMSPDHRQAVNGESAEQVAIRAANELDILLQREHGCIAALIVEPLVQCAGQMAMHSPEYLRLARKLCDQYGVHLIADEIAVGCGRTGRFFACEHAGIWPDFMTLSKGISGGYLPLSLCLTTDCIYEAFYSDETARGFLHSHSYTGNPLACTAALACLELFKTERVLEQNQGRAQDLSSAFAWTHDDARIEHSRQQGMILAFDIRASALPSPNTFARDVFSVGIQEGLLIRPIGSTIYVMPPYILSAEQTMAMGQGIRSVLERVLPVPARS